MRDKTTFPISSGLLTPEHYEKVGPALWEFCWLIDKTTRDVEKNGVTWGVVLGGKPIDAREIADAFGKHPETVKKNLRRLKEYGYISVKRTNYGMVIGVRKSIKFSVRGKKKQEITNQSLIGELGDKYRSIIPEDKQQKGDFSFIGRMYNEHGYDRVLTAINELGYQVESGSVPDEPLLYLKGIISGGNSRQSGRGQTKKYTAVNEKHDGSKKSKYSDIYMT